MALALPGQAAVGQGPRDGGGQGRAPPEQDARRALAEED